MGRDAEDPRSWSTELCAGPRTAAEARWFLADALRDEDVDRDAAFLLTSEVAANAARHGKEPIDLRVSVERDGLRVSVVDRGEGFEPDLLEEPEDGGWGLRLVNHIASSWGVDRTDDGTEVWFTI